ncbi:accessory Sec system translocase SecA2 [Streptococcus merionis]|uniref:accessory Sec system translocase SecA2 n=1 Tax=Streptococcus merionis TaxID=400065 RepID=UPI003515F013
MSHMPKKQKTSLLNKFRLRRLHKILAKINALADSMAAMTDEELQGQTERFKERLSKGETLDDILVEAFATIREADKRVLGTFPYDVQVIGGLILHQGDIAEMKTGEGKTLTATLPIYLNALSGKGAILVTTNEYLARRDAEEMGQVYNWLGLSIAVGFAEEDSDEEWDYQKRQDVYNSDIVYTTNGALGFDYLTDNLVANAKDKFLRPFHFVIVDEVDAVLLDSAQTPLIISGSPRVQSNLYNICDQFVTTLVEDEDYELDENRKAVWLKRPGIEEAERFFDIPNLFSGDYYEHNRHINLALKAHHLYKKGVDYVIDDDEVKLLDRKTGRILEGIRLQGGVHQALEAKEHTELTEESRAMASITLQALFQMVPKLAGMTGTGKVAENEFIKTYQMAVIQVPTNRPLRRIDYPDAIYATLPEKLYATLEEVKRIHATGQPILLVSGTVEIAEVYSSMLLKEGIPHSTLTANNIPKEAQIIKEAGQLGAVTVATPLAGRGTDIKLGEGVKELGGLAVIGTEMMPSRRIDLQLRGRSGRQGDPGMSKFFLSLEDEVVLENGPKWVHKYFENYESKGQGFSDAALKPRRFRRAIEYSQKAAESKGESARATTVAFDQSMTVQREKVYGERDRLVFEDDKLFDEVALIVNESVNRFIETHSPMTEEKLRRYILDNMTYKFRYFPDGFDVTDEAQVEELLMALYDKEIANKKQLLITDDGIADFYRLSVLKAIDTLWIEEVDALQQLKSVVSSRSIAQRDTMQEYHKESLISYDKMRDKIKDQIVKNIMLSVVNHDKKGRKSIYYM